MKATIVKKVKYPLIAVGKNKTIGLIVLFTTQNIGTPLQNGDNTSCVLGEEQRNWAKCTEDYYWEIPKSIKITFKSKEAGFPKVAKCNTTGDVLLFHNETSGIKLTGLLIGHYREDRSIISGTNWKILPEITIKFKNKQ